MRRLALVLFVLFGCDVGDGGEGEPPEPYSSIVVCEAALSCISDECPADAAPIGSHECSEICREEAGEANGCASFWHVSEADPACPDDYKTALGFVWDRALTDAAYCLDANTSPEDCASRLGQCVAYEESWSGPA